MTNTYTLYSKTALERVLGISKSAIKRMEIWVYVVWIHVAGRRPKFYSKRPFLLLFGQQRKEAGQKLEVKDLGGVQFRVVSEGKSSKMRAGEDSYGLTLFQQQIICECKDYRSQCELMGGDLFPPEERAFKRPICKHGYAVLKFLGFGSLKDYLEKTDHIDWIATGSDEVKRRYLEFAAAGF